jgi:ABC-2 type transport system ATP-binding protein
MDPDSRTIFYDIINSLRQQGKTILISTHNLDEIQKYADHVIIIKQGEVMYEGSAKDQDLYKIYEQYADNPVDTTASTTKKITASDIFGK